MEGAVGRRGCPARIETQGGRQGETEEGERDGIFNRWKDARSGRNGKEDRGRREEELNGNSAWKTRRAPRGRKNRRRENGGNREGDELERKIGTSFGREVWKRGMRKVGKGKAKGRLERDDGQQGWNGGGGKTTMEGGPRTDCGKKDWECWDGQGEGVKIGKEERKMDYPR